MKSFLILFQAIAVSMALFSCSHDTAEVRDKQRAEDERRRQEEKNQLTPAIGTYDGQLLIDGSQHRMMVIVGSVPQPGDSKPILTAIVKRTDIVFDKDAELQGNFTATTGDIYLSTQSSGNSKIREWETSVLEGKVINGRFTGELKRSGGKTLGTFALAKVSDRGNAENIDRCHEFYNEARDRVENLIGKYELTLESNTALPSTKDFFIKPSSDPNSLAVDGAVPTDTSFGSLFEIHFVPYVRGGTLYMSSVLQSGGRTEDLSITVSVVPGKTNSFKGSFESSTGRWGTAYLTRDPSYPMPPLCR